MSACNDEQEVRAAFAEYLRRTNLHDFRAVMPCITPDAVYRFGTQVYAGRSAIRPVFEAAWARTEDEKYSATAVELVGLQGDMAVISYRYHWIGHVAGQPFRGGGLGTNVLRRTASGWRISYEHLSLGEVQPLSPLEAESTPIKG
jgi:ketosteroid isomerase-like protein